MTRSRKALQRFVYLARLLISERCLHVALSAMPDGSPKQYELAKALRQYFAAIVTAELDGR